MKSTIRSRRAMSMKINLLIFSKAIAEVAPVVYLHAPRFRAKTGGIG